MSIYHSILWLLITVVCSTSGEDISIYDETVVHQDKDGQQDLRAKRGAVMTFVILITIPTSFAWSMLSMGRFARTKRK